MIEGDLRTVRTAPAAAASAAAAVEMREEAPRASMPTPLQPLSAAALAQPLRRSRSRNCRIPPRCKRARRNILPPRRANSTPRSRRRRSPRRCRRAPSAKSWSRMPPRRAPRSRRNCRRIIRSSRARGRPRASLRRRSGSPLPKTRSAKLLPGRKEPVSSSSFIAAARRAAQAAAAAPPPEKAGRSARRPRQGQGRRQGQGQGDDKEPSNITSKIRSLLVGASVVVIVLGTFKMAMTLLDTGSVPQLPLMESPSSRRPGAGARAAENSARPAMPAAPAAPSMISPTPIGRQSNNSSAPNTLDSARIAIPQQAAPPPAAASDVTGAIPTLPPPAASLPDRRCRRPSGCPTASADRCCAPPR